MAASAAKIRLKTPALLQRMKRLGPPIHLNHGLRGNGILKVMNDWIAGLAAT